MENIDETTFEKLVNTICQRILGTGVISFSKGKDGGRDGKFTGTAKNYPSTTDNWQGQFIIQAKHTENPIASCSDKDFQRLIAKIEIPKVKKLKYGGLIDNYLLFTNRKYTAVKGEQLFEKIKRETGVNNVAIIGKESINDLYLNSNKDIVRLFHLNLNIIPFDFSDEEMKEIILSFKEQLPIIEDEIKNRVEELKRDFTYVDKSIKNRKNRLSEGYFNDEIASKSLMEFEKIEAFLNNPINNDLKNYYFDTASELNQIISLKREDFDLFEEIFLYIYKRVCDGSQVLMGKKRHVMTFLHYMYFECSIGKK